MAGTAGGQWREATGAVALMVESHFWQTTWFLLATGLLSVGAAALVSAWLARGRGAEGGGRGRTSSQSAWESRGHCSCGEQRDWPTVERSDTAGRPPHRDGTPPGRSRDNSGNKSSATPLWGGLFFGPRSGGVASLGHRLPPLFPTGTFPPLIPLGLPRTQRFWGLCPLPRLKQAFNEGPP